MREQVLLLLLVLVIIFTLLGTLGVLGSPDKNRYFVAAGDGDTPVAYSSDGKNWNTVSNIFGDGGYGNKVVVEGKRYFVVGEDGDSLNRTAYYAYADNMSVWTPITWNDDGPDSNKGTAFLCDKGSDIFLGDNICVQGFGDVGAGQSGISYSSDGGASHQLAPGTNFQNGGAAYLQTIDIGSISNNITYWIICGNENSNEGVVYTAPLYTPQTWTAASIPSGFTNVVLAGFSTGTYEVNPYLIAGTTTNTLPIAWSDPTNGMVYTRSTGAGDDGESSAGTYSVRTMSYYGGVLVCCGEAGTGLSGAGFSLDDGKTWKQCIVTNGSVSLTFTTVSWDFISNGWLMADDTGSIYQSSGLVNGDFTWTKNETLSTGTNVEVTNIATDRKTRVVTASGEITLYRQDSKIQVIDDIFESQGNDVIYG